jgi:hypothetical protein
MVNAALSPGGHSLYNHTRTDPLIDGGSEMRYARLGLFLMIATILCSIVLPAAGLDM